MSKRRASRYLASPTCGGESVLGMEARDKAAMAAASNALFHALWQQHPQIIRHLTKGRDPCPRCNTRGDIGCNHRHTERLVSC